MNTVSFGKVEYELFGSPWTLVIYKREFKTSFNSDLAEAYAGIMQGSVDIDPTFLLQAAWAMAKTANDLIPSYDDWVKSLEDFSLAGYMGTWGMEVQASILADLFRGCEKPTES